MTNTSRGARAPLVAAHARPLRLRARPEDLDAIATSGAVIATNPELQPASCAPASRRSGGDPARLPRRARRRRVGVRRGRRHVCARCGSATSCMAAGVSTASSRAALSCRPSSPTAASPTARRATARCGRARPPTSSCSTSTNSTATRSCRSSRSTSSSLARHGAHVAQLFVAGRGDRARRKLDTRRSRRRRKRTLRDEYRERMPARAAFLDAWAKPRTGSPPRSIRDAARLLLARKSALWPEHCRSSTSQRLETARRGWQRLAAEIGAACRDVGFFYVINHGVPTQTDRRRRSRSRARFFALPLAQKQAHRDREGWRQPRLFGAAARGAGSHASAPDMKEAFNIGLDLAARRSGTPGRRSRSAR